MEPEPTASESCAGPPNGRRMQTGVRTLLVLVASLGLVFWAARSIWETQHPAFNAARGLQARIPSDRVNAIRLLERTDLRDIGIAIPPLIGALSDPESVVRVAACDALGPLASAAVINGTSPEGVRAATAALIRSSTDPAPAVRTASAAALGRIISINGSIATIDLETTYVGLAGMLGDQDTAVRAAVLYTLGLASRKLTVEPPPALAADLTSQNSALRVAAVEALACFQRGLDPWVPRILKTLEREDDLHARTDMLNAVGQIKPPAISRTALAPLIAALGSQQDGVRVRVAFLIQTLGHDAVPAVPDLVNLIARPIDTTKVGPGQMHPAVWDSAWAAVLALGKIAPGTPVAGEVIEALTAVVRFGHPYRRVAATHALSEFGPAAGAAIPALIEVIEHNMTTKAYFADGADAATALGKIAPGTPLANEAIAAIVKALQAKSEFTRRQAASALLPFGQKARIAIPRLRLLANDPDAEVRSAAAQAIDGLEAKQ
jgi:HEAT repeat protein